MSANVLDLSTFKKAAPLKTREELRLEFLLKRRGKFTASQFSKLVTSLDKEEFPRGAKAYALEKAVELVTEIDEQDTFVSYAMQWGIDHELEGIAAFEKMTEMSVLHTGENQKTINLGDDIACTPDGISKIFGLSSEFECGIEVKCPNSKTHFEYSSIKSAIDLKKIAPDYYWQVQGGMYITGYNYWYFISYDPRFKDKSKQLHYALIERNDNDIDLLSKRIFMAIAYRNYLLKEFRGE